MHLQKVWFDSREQGRRVSCLSLWYRKLLVGAELAGSDDATHSTYSLIPARILNRQTVRVRWGTVRSSWRPVGTSVRQGFSSSESFAELISCHLFSPLQRRLSDLLLEGLIDRMSKDQVCLRTQLMAGFGRAYSPQSPPRNNLWMKIPLLEFEQG